jgi:hypothetical protein
MDVTGMFKFLHRLRKTHTNEALVAAMKRDAGSATFFRTLLKSTLLVPYFELTQQSPDGPGQVKCYAIENEGHLAIAAFTDIRALKRYFQTQDVTWTGLSGLVLCGLAVQGHFSEIVINPAGPTGCVIGDLAIKALAEGIIPVDAHKILIDDTAAVHIDMPGHRPSISVLEALRDTAARGGAREVYWFQVTFPGGQPHIALAVAPSDEDIVLTIVNALEENRSAWDTSDSLNAIIDIFTLDNRMFAQKIRERGELLYEEE